MSNSSTLFVGMDVHKESIDVAIAAGTLEGEIRHYGQITHTIDSIDKLVAKLRRKSASLLFVYEAGPCGFGLYRHLTRKGHGCVVVAPSMIPKRAGDRVKTDKRDSIKLARLQRAGELSPIHIPDVADEAMRDLTRAREDAVCDQRKARQRLKSFLLRHGVRYAGKANWGEKHLRWLAELIMPTPEQQIVFQEYVHAVTEQTHRIGHLELAIIERVQQWRYFPVVEAVQALRGVALITATAIVAEIGDFGRFAKPRQLMNFIGLTPSQYSTGERVKLGPITKTGNAHVRRLLVEAAWAYRYPAKVSRTIQIRHERLPLPIREIAWKAQLRLCARYRRLTTKGKNTNVVITAIARELCAFLWDIARKTPIQAQ